MSPCLRDHWKLCGTADIQVKPEGRDGILPNGEVEVKESIMRPLSGLGFRSGLRFSYATN